MKFWKRRGPRMETLCVDFDGVIHSYSSGWQGARNIPDSPVPGALEWLAKMSSKYTVCILSARSGALFGRRAMRKWLKAAYLDLCPSWEGTPRWLQDEIAPFCFADPWGYECQWGVAHLMDKIKFVKRKPGAVMYIDDRAWKFEGVFPTENEIDSFTPWEVKR